MGTSSTACAAFASSSLIFALSWKMGSFEVPGPWHRASFPIPEEGSRSTGYLRSWACPELLPVTMLLLAFYWHRTSPTRKMARASTNICWRQSLRLINCQGPNAGTWYIMMLWSSWLSVNAEHNLSCPRLSFFFFFFASSKLS